MIYKRPELVASGSLLDAIRSSTEKDNPIVGDNVTPPLTFATCAAYEADE
jgi:hypothetical protein